MAAKSGEATAAPLAIAAARELRGRTQTEPPDYRKPRSERGTLLVAPFL